VSLAGVILIYIYNIIYIIYIYIHRKQLLLAVGAGKSNNCSKEPIKASKSFIVPLKALIISYSDSYTLHNGSQSLLSALSTREARTQLITGSYQLSSALLVMLLRA